MTGRIANIGAALESGRAMFVHADIATGLDALRDDLTAATRGKMSAIYHLASATSQDAYVRNPFETLTANSADP